MESPEYQNSCTSNISEKSIICRNDSNIQSNLTDDKEIYLTINNDESKNKIHENVSNIFHLSGQEQFEDNFFENENYSGRETKKYEKNLKENEKFKQLDNINELRKTDSLNHTYLNGHVIEVIESTDVRSNIECNKFYITGESIDSEDSSTIDSTLNEMLNRGIWNKDNILEFLTLREEQECEIENKGEFEVIKGILTHMGLIKSVSIYDGILLWNCLNSKKLKNMRAKDEDLVQDEMPRENGVKNKCWNFIFDLNFKINLDNSCKKSKRKKLSQYKWPLNISKKFIKLRAKKQKEIAKKGHDAVYREIISELGLNNILSVINAKRRWSHLIKKFQEEINAKESSWELLSDMKNVFEQFKSDTSKLKTRASPEFLWPNELTKKFIELKVKMHKSFLQIGVEAYECILEELGVSHVLNANNLRKKWNYLVAKYKEVSVSLGDSPMVDSWPFYTDMKKALESTLINANVISVGKKVIKSKLENLWTVENVKNLIQCRALKISEEDFKKKPQQLFSEIVNELGFRSEITAYKARRKWNQLCIKYQDLSEPTSTEHQRNSWPYYEDMKIALQKIPYITVEREIDEQIFEPEKSNSCYLCGKVDLIFQEYFVFEPDQKLLNLQKTVTEILTILIGKKFPVLEKSTILCSSCTDLVNEADYTISKYNKIKEQARNLYDVTIDHKTIEINEKDLENNENNLETNENNFSVDPDYVPSNAINLEIIDNENFLLPSTIFKNGNNNNSTDIDGSEKTNDDSKRECFTYSKSGRRIKCANPDNSVYSYFPFFSNKMKTEVEARSKQEKRGRKKCSKKIKSTLIGRGLGGKYSDVNKKTVMSNRSAKVYKCSECTKVFKRYIEYRKHRKTTHRVLDTSKIELKETVLENGVITYFNKEKTNNHSTLHKCKICAKIFLRKDDLCHHEEITHTSGTGKVKSSFKDRAYVCEECGETFLFLYKLKMHINAKHLNIVGDDANDFTCGLCGCKLGSLPGLTFHMRKHHNKSLSYKKQTEYLCSDCGFVAPSNSKLKNHQRNNCNDPEKPRDRVPCEICGKTFLQVSLKTHKIKMHSAFKEQCDRCGEKYATKADLLKHVNVYHLKIKLYQCQVCDEKFSTSDALRYHKLKMHEKPKFDCQTCGKVYKRPGELNAHFKRVHSRKRKAVVCNLCGKEYFDKSGLRTHLIAKHDVPEEMTYSQSYLRKKRIDNLLKEPEKDEQEPAAVVIQQENPSNSNPTFIQQISQTNPQHFTQTQPHTTIIQHPTMIVGGQATIPTIQSLRPVSANHSDLTRNYTYHREAGAPEESLVVTEITAAPQVEHAVLIEPMSFPSGSVLSHIPTPNMSQNTSAMHLHPAMHHSNMRFNVVYQMPQASTQMNIL